MGTFRFFELRHSGLIVVALAAFGLASCADTRGGPIPYDVSDFGVPDSPSTTALASTYKIAPMDTLAIKVFGLEKISGDYQVDLLGNVAMPLIGDVAAADLTPSQFDDLLTQEYSQKYLENPDISVGIKASAGRIVTVDGSVQRAGSFPVGGPMTLMQAVALAGGVDDRANAHRVAIFRTIDGKRQAAAFDLVSIRHGEMQDPPVYAGDIVVVDGSSIKDAQRKIFQSFPLLTVFRPFIL